VNPQIAADIAQGQGRVRSFLEQIQPGPARMMPDVAGFQKPDTTIPPQARTVMQNAPAMPTLAGQAVQPITPCVNCTSPARLGTLRGLGATIRIPTWLKWTFAFGLVLGGGYLVYRVSQR
jgi:hypothetical protein